MNNKKVSVIVPVWNAHEYLNRCVDSIVNQTYKNLEIILVDDGSTDDSLKICKEYEKKDERIRVVHKENGGQSSARNLALDICTGEYIGFVDNDDWIFPTMYEKMVELIEKYDADVARCADESDEKMINIKSDFQESVCKEKEYHKLLFCDIWGGHVTDRLFKREVIGDVRFPVSKTIEDMRFMRMILNNIHSEAYTSEKLYFYTVREDSTSFVYARSFINACERAKEYQSRYMEAVDKYPEYLDILLQKATTFSCGTMNILKGKRKSDEYIEMKRFIKLNKHNILALPNLSIKYKLFALLM